MVESGLDVFLKQGYQKYRKLKLGVLCHPASVNDKLRHISELLLDAKLKLNLSCFMGPQHGIRGEKQDNMVESEDFIDPVTSRPVFSLYSDTRTPTPEMLNHFDALIVDMQDIGTRIYTFIYTMANCMRALSGTGKKLIILDRPNPINGITVEGNTLDTKFVSFVGQFALPARHGMTMAELALMFRDLEKLDVDIDIIKMRGWKRNTFADTWGRAWIPSSPNIPTLASAISFPGTVHFEGTNISEGRGTTMPFEWIGAPYIQPDRLAKKLNSLKLPGTYFRPIYFQPTFHKGMNEVCGGVQIHALDRRTFPSFRAGIELLSAIAELFPNEFAWKKPPYEYEYKIMPIDLIAGTNQLRELINEKKSLKPFFESAKKSAKSFEKLRREYLIYK